MAQIVNVNFRLDEDVKKSMEQVCSELGLSMSAAFTIFAKKVGRERRIPFEVSADPFYNAENIAELERRVNEVIQRNLDVTTEFITQQEAAQRFDMKRLPEGASDTVRVVHVGDYDQCLCIGLHVANTSEIGTFKITTHSYADGIFRIRFKLEK